MQGVWTPDQVRGAEQRLFERTPEPVVMRRAAYAVAKGTLKAGDASFEAGRLKTLTLAGDNLLLGTPFTFTKDNVDQFDF